MDEPADPGPSVRGATIWITCHPASLTPGQAAELDKTCDRSPTLRVTRELAADFAQMLVERRGRELETWIKAAQASGIAPLASFATGLYKDWDAVVDGLTLPYSSGVVERHVNRVEMIKRQMDGRVGFHLLRK